jgi:hypothetical protein
MPVSGGMYARVLSQVIGVISRAMAHMNDAGSRATAGTAMLGCLPREVSLWYRLQSRS